MFMQTPHFFSPFYFPQAGFRCFHAQSVAFFHNGIFRPQVTSSDAGVPLKSRQLRQTGAKEQQTWLTKHRASPVAPTAFPART
jgi:hypothetical protein